MLAGKIDASLHKANLHKAILHKGSSSMTLGRRGFLLTLAATAAVARPMCWRGSSRSATRIPKVD
jgi:hypothetical protein